MTPILKPLFATLAMLAATSAALAQDFPVTIDHAFGSTTIAPYIPLEM